MIRSSLFYKPEFYAHSFLIILIEKFSFPTLFKNLYEKILNTHGSQKVEGKQSFNMQSVIWEKVEYCFFKITVAHYEH